MLIQTVSASEGFIISQTVFSLSIYTNSDSRLVDGLWWTTQFH